MLKTTRSRSLLLAFAIVINIFVLSSDIARGQSISLAWNPSSSANVAGYEVFCGTNSGQYDTSVDVGAATNATITGLTGGTTYYLAVLGYDSDGNQSPYSNEITNTVPLPPVIRTNPASQQASLGATVTFNVAVTGSGPISYQWFHGAILLRAETNAILALTDVASAQAGEYSVVASNPGGSVTSRAAALTIIGEPIITSQPESVTAVVGGTIQLSATVTGAAPFIFQWYEGHGEPVSGGTNATLRLANLAATNAGSYFLVVRNVGGLAMSAKATVTISGVSTNTIVSNLFSVVAGAYNGLFYQTNGNLPAVNVETAGMLANCIVGTNGVFSAKLYIAGTNYPFGGTFDSAGAAAAVVSRGGSGQSNLTVRLVLDMSGESQQMTGTVSNMAPTNSWTAPLLADLATNTGVVPAGNFTLTVPAIVGALGVLTGQGEITVTESASGTAILAGTMDDLTAVSQTAPVSAEGIIPLYFNMYGGTGLALGWVDLAGGNPNGTITWIRPPGILTGLLIPAGFTDVLSLF
jgi:hypothetical protein